MPQLDQGGDVIGVALEQGLELGDCLAVMAQRGVGAGQLPARVAVVGTAPEPLVQLGDPAVVVAVGVVGDLEVGLRDLHLGVELEGAQELGDGLGHQPLLVVQDAEVVVGPGVGRIDAAGERAEDGEIALGECGSAHGGLKSGGWRRR